MDIRENKLWLIEHIKNYVNNSTDNTLSIIDERAWGEPMVGFSSGADALFSQIKDDIGDFYWLPEEIYKLSFLEEEIKSTELTVMSWFLPQTEQTKLMQKQALNYPSQRWALSRLFGQEFNNKVAKYIVEVLHKAGYKAIAPSLSKYWENKKSKKYGYASTWSERHTAFI